MPRGRRRGGLESRRGESPVGGRVPAIRLRRARNRPRHAHGIHFPRHHGASRFPENIRRLPYEIFGILADYPNGKSNFERARNSRARFGRIQGAGFVAARGVCRGGRLFHSRRRHFRAGEKLHGLCRILIRPRAFPRARERPKFFLRARRRGRGKFFPFRPNIRKSV